jgi:Zn-dependent protease
VELTGLRPGPDDERSPEALAPPAWPRPAEARPAAVTAPGWPRPGEDGAGAGGPGAEEPSPWWPGEPWPRPLGEAPPPHAGSWDRGAGQLAPPVPGGQWGPQRPAAPSRPGAQGAPRGPKGKLRRAWQRAVGILAAVGAFIAKFGALILKLKYLSLVGTMLLSIVAYSLFFGWTFAVGFVLLILVHEMGHVVELRRQGTKASLPVFIPFLGAFVNMKQMPRSAYHEALSGLAGPYSGTLASVAVALWGRHSGSNFLLQLAAVGFLINLFNLLPVLPLDGGRAAAALHPVLWLVGLAGLLAFAFFVQSPVVLIVLVLGGFELWRRWTRRNSPAARAYHALRPAQRLGIGLLYLLIVAVAMAGYVLTYVPRNL